MASDYFLNYVQSFLPEAIDPIDLTLGIGNLDEPEVVRVCQNEGSARNPRKAGLVIDGECCMHRLYGGNYSNWVCGGDWNRMLKFLDTFMDVASRSNIEFTVFFNGALEPDRMNAWAKDQIIAKRRIETVLNHVYDKATVPPIGLWVRPSGLRTFIRLALRHLGVRVVVTSADHHLEVISHMKEFHYHGLLADHFDYIFFGPPRYFSATELKLTFKANIQTKEIKLRDVARLLNIPASRMYLVAALMGNHILTQKDLLAFHRSLNPEIEVKKRPFDVIKSVVEYVKNLESVDDLTEIAEKIFGTDDDRCDKFKLCVYYYCQGYQQIEAGADQPEQQEEVQDAVNIDLESKVVEEKSDTENLDELSCLMKEVFIKMSEEQEENEQSPNERFIDSRDLNSKGTIATRVTEQYDQPSTSSSHEKSSTSGYDHQSTSFAVNYDQPSTYAVNYDQPSTLYAANYDQASTCAINYDQPSSMYAPSTSAYYDQPSTSFANNEGMPIYDVDPRILQKALDRHSRGLMHPYIYQVLNHREVKIAVMMEDNYEFDFPASIYIFRPLRQMMYGVLFSIHQQMIEGYVGSSGAIDVIVKEWVYSGSNWYKAPHLVPACYLDWQVPTISDLWFGCGLQANEARMKAFLSCMRCDVPAFYEMDSVPRGFYVLCCVLRYLITGSEVFLERHELDAFLVQAVVLYLKRNYKGQVIKLDKIEHRGVTLAALFLEGVEHAIMANDVCGSPLLWEEFCPWLFFEGMLFHQKFLKSYSSRDIYQLCDFDVQQISIVEKMRNFITFGLSIRHGETDYNTSVTFPPGISEFPYDGTSPLEAAGVVFPMHRGGAMPFSSDSSRMNTFRGVSRGRPTESTRRPFGNRRNHRPRGASSSSSRSSGKMSSANICLGLGRGAPNPEDAEFYDKMVNPR